MATKTRRLADLLANIDDNSKVTSAGLLDATITASDLAADSVDSSELVDGAVDTSHIGDLQVTTGKVAASAVTTAKVADNAVTGAKIAADTIPVKPHIQPGTLYPAWGGLLDNHTGYTFTDSSAGGQVFVPYGNVHHSGVQKKVGSTSIRFEGVGHHAKLTGTAAMSTSGDYTVEFWIKSNVAQQDAALWDWRRTGQTGGSTNINIRFKTGGLRVIGSADATFDSGNPLDDLDWHHVAVVRASGTVKVYFDGVADSTTSSMSGTTVDAATNELTFGAGYSNTDNGNFYIDEIRYSKLAVYTGNFTAPTVALTTTWSAGTNIAANSTASNVQFLMHSDNGGHVGAYGTAQADGRKYYYTDIKGSKPIKDPRIGAHFGSQRHKIKSIQLLEQETATQGGSDEASDVFTIDGREWMRCTGGNWHIINNGHGTRLAVGNVSSYPNAYIEVVGYFNGINTTAYTDSNHKFRYSLDGQSEVATDYGANASGHHLSGTGTRFVDSGSVSNIPISTTLGIHTIKLRSTGAEHDVFGVELIAQGEQDFTATNATNILTSAGHTLTNGDQIRLTGSDLPNGLNATTTYYVIGVSGNNFQVSASLGGSAVTFSDDGSGTRTFTSLNNIQIPAQNVVSYGKKFSLSAAAEHYNPFTFKTDGTTAWAVAAHNGTSLPVGTGASANIDTTTSLGLDNWKHSNNYYRPYNGGRVVKWIASDGTIKTSVNVMPPNARSIKNADITKKANASAANDTYLPTVEIGTVDDSQAEVARSFHWREFGNGCGNAGTTGSQTWADASELNNDDNIAYAMDDGLTSFTGVDVDKHANYDSWDILSSSEYAYYTFIGTGFSIHQVNPNTCTFTYDIWVDGVLIQDDAILTGTGWKHLCQNLPYGTHIIKFNNTGTTGAQVASFDEISIHQPKMPPIPADAVVLADYMLMADFKPQTNYGAGYISKGVRSCNISRDVYFSETDGNTFALALQVSNSYGFQMTLDGTADSDTTAVAKLSAFGTNYIHRAYQSDTRVKLYLDGVDKDSAATKDNNADHGSYAHLTNDLALGLYSFGANSVSGQAINQSAFEIATPIHTSSHYQSFDSPFDDELVGGDRNMEQNNLIVTADGKSWDEVTRDTSYLGNLILSIAETDVHSGDSNSITTLSDRRGSMGGNGTSHSFEKKQFFVTAWDRIICLKEGQYIIDFFTRSAGANTAWRLAINSTATTDGHGFYFNIIDNADTETFRSPVLHLQRGDFLYLKKEGGTIFGVNHEAGMRMEITRLNK